MEYIQKLTSLFEKSVDEKEHDNNKFYELINMLQQKHVIAGGSIVWLLNDFVPKNTVGDIDVFVNMEEEYTKLITLLKTKYNATLSSISQNSYGTFENCGVVSAKIFNRITIQLILLAYTDPMDVLQSFDLDYVQCALHNNTIYKTDACAESHLARAILCYKPPCKFTRFSKVLKKGFIAPYLGDFSHAPSIPIADESNLDYFTYIKKQEMSLVPVSIPVIHKLCKPDKPMILEHSNYQTSIVPIEYKMGDIISQTEVFALKITVTEINSIGCVIQPIKFGPITINMSNTPVSMTLGDNIVIASLRWVRSPSKKYALRLKIKERVSKRYVPCILADDICIDESMTELIAQGIVINSDVEINKPEINKEKIMKLINKLEKELQIL